MDIRRVGGMEVSQDLAFHRRSRRVQRVGWAVFSLLLLAAALGLLGGEGPLARATAGAGGPLQVEYSRFARHGAETTMVIHLQQDAAAGQEVRVAVDQAYLRAVRLQAVVPEPALVIAGAERAIYVFPLEAPGAAATIRFLIDPQRQGSHTIRVGLEGGQELAFSQVIFP